MKVEDTENLKYLSCSVDNNNGLAQLIIDIPKMINKNLDTNIYKLKLKLNFLLKVMDNALWIVNLI